MTRTYTRDEVQAVVRDIKAKTARACGTEGYASTYLDAVDEVLRRLDALPNQPAGPESSAPSFTTNLSADGYLRLARLTPKRPRATTPTPEVPALSVLGFPVVAESGIPAGEVHLRQEGKPVVRITNAEPTAPEVVWQQDGFRVHADGTYSTESDWMAYPLNTDVAHLARALAEAKREAKVERVKADAGRAVAREQAAESMRERAKVLIMAEQAKQEDGPLSDDNGHSFNLLLRLAHAVDALSLEEP